jgi:Zn-dependent protease
VTEERIAQFITIGIILLVSFPVHEFSHALAALRLGDGTAKLFGRLTLNPIVHFDPLGGLMLLLTGLLGFGFGWAKPTPVNPNNLRGGRQGEAIVSFAGPASNLVLAVAAALPLRYILATDVAVPDLVTFILADFVLINLALMVFNLIPIPPLDGAKVLYALLDPRTAYQVRPYLEQYGFFFLFFLIIPLGPGGSILGRLFVAIVGPLSDLLVGRPLVG